MNGSSQHPDLGSLTLVFGSLAANQTAIVRVREAVFQQEQGIAPELDWDGLDATAIHAIAYWQGDPISTARIRYLQAQAKIERVAVLPAYRGQGVGRQMFLGVLDYLANQWFSTAFLYAQTSTQGFYQKLGFTPQGPEFSEAGIPHRKMMIQLSESGLKNRRS